MNNQAVFYSILIKYVEISILRLEKELEGKQYIANNEYTIADITAQCAFVMAKAAIGIRIPEEMANLTQWWKRVTSRPTSRA